LTKPDQYHTDDRRIVRVARRAPASRYAFV
jgi:hypothetical protein